MGRVFPPKDYRACSISFSARSPMGWDSGWRLRVRSWKRTEEISTRKTPHPGGRCSDADFQIIRKNPKQVQLISRHRATTYLELKIHGTGRKRRWKRKYGSCH